MCSFAFAIMSRPYHTLCRLLSPRAAPTLASTLTPADWHDLVGILEGFEQGSRGAGEYGSMGAGEQGSTGAREYGSMGAGEQGTSAPPHPSTSAQKAPPHHRTLAPLPLGTSAPPHPSPSAPQHPSTLLAGTQDRFGTRLPQGVLEALAEASDGRAKWIVARGADPLQTTASALSFRARLRLLLAVAVPNPAYMRWRYKPRPAWLWPLCYFYRWFDIVREGVSTLWRMTDGR